MVISNASLAPWSRRSARDGRDPLLDLADIGGDPTRHPTVAEPCGPGDRVVGVAAEDDRRVRGAGGTRREVDRLEVEMTPVVRRLLLGPERAQHLDALLHPREPSAGVEPERGELLRQPSGADPQDRPPAGQDVDRGHRTRGDERVAEREHVDPGAEPDRRRRRGDRARGSPTGRTAGCRARTGTTRRGCTGTGCRPARGRRRGRARTPSRSRPPRPGRRSRHVRRASP